MANKAGMSSGIEVARISVKVSPDTRQFRRELQAELDAIERSVKGKVQVEAKANTAKAEAQLNNAARDRKAELKIDVDQSLLKSYAELTSRLKGNVTPNLKGEAFARQIDGMVAAFNKKYPLGVKLDPSDVRDVIAEITALKKLMTDGDSALGVKPDVGMKRQQEMLRQLDELSKIRLTVDDADLKSKVDRLRADLSKPIPMGITADDRIVRSRIESQLNSIRDYVAKNKVEVDVEVDKNKFSDEFADALASLVKGAGSAAGKAAGKAAEGLSEAVGGALETLGPKPKSNLWPKFGSGLNAAAIGIVVAGAVAAIGPLVGTVATSLLALPGLISLMLTPIAAVTLGLDGFKKAAEKIKPQFEELKKTMNAASETSFTPVLQRVADEIFPKLQARLPRVTEGLAQMSQGILDGLAGPRFENIITRIGDAFAALRPGIASFTSGMVGLTDQFTAKLPGITEWINKAGAGFSAWVDKVSKDGSLDSALSNLGTVFSQIASSVTNIGKAGVEFMADPKNLELALDAVKGIETVFVNAVELSGQISQKWVQIKQIAESIKLPEAFEALGRMGETFKDTTNEGDKPLSDQSIGYQAAGGFGNHFMQSIKAALGNKEAQQYMDDFFIRTGQGALYGGQQAGEKYQEGFESVIKPGIDKPDSRPRPKIGTPAETPETAPKIEPPQTEEAKAKLEEYDKFVTDVSARVKESMSKVTEGDTLPPPNLEAFKSAWNSLPTAVAQAAQAAIQAAIGLVEGVNAALQGGTQAILITVTGWPTIVQAALSSMNAIGNEAGLQLANGMVAGINAGIEWVSAAARNLAAAAKSAANAELGIKSPSREFIKIGKYTAEGMAIGLENGIEPVVAQAKDMAWKISEVFAKGGDPTEMMKGFGNKEVSRMEKVLAFESKRLGYQAKALDYQAKTTGNTALKAQADAIRMKKEELDLQKEMVGLTQDYADLNGEEKFSESPLGKAVQTMMNMPQDFLGAMGEQLMSDFGIEGGGALSSIADYGMGLANNFVFNVSNVDEAMAVHRNQVAKQSAGIVGR